MHGLEPSPSDMLLCRSASIGLPLRIEVIAFAVGGGGPNQLWDRLQESAITAFAVSQRRFGNYSFGHVSPNRRDENALVRPPSAERYLKLRRLTIFPAPSDLHFGGLKVHGVTGEANR